MSLSTTYFNSYNFKFQLIPVLQIALLSIMTICVSSEVFAKQENVLSIENSWIRQAPPKSKVLAAYLELNNKTKKKWTLIKITSDNFEKIEIHNSMKHDGMIHMQQQLNIAIPALQKVIFEPNGLHLMLINPSKALIAGDEVIMNFMFDNARSIQVNVVVKKRQSDLKATHSQH